MPTPRRPRLPTRPEPGLGAGVGVGMLVGLLVGVVLSLGGLVVAGAASGAGSASSCPPLDVPASTKAAQAVFVGVVDGEPVASAKSDGRGSVYATDVTVQTVYQGRIRTSSAQVQTDRTPKQCSLGPLVAGRRYVFFVQGDGDPWVAVSGAGTARATDSLVTSVVSILGQGRPPVQPTPTQARFISMHPAAPQRFTRAAAPGVALVLVGLLGLMLVRGRSRQP